MAVAVVLVADGVGDTDDGDSLGLEVGIDPGLYGGVGTGEKVEADGDDEEVELVAVGGPGRLEKGLVGQRGWGRRGQGGRSAVIFAEGGLDAAGGGGTAVFIGVVAGGMGVIPFVPGEIWGAFAGGEGVAHEGDAEDAGSDEAGWYLDGVDGKRLRGKAGGRQNQGGEDCFGSHLLAPD